MLYGAILGLHIAAGLASCVLAPLYVAAALHNHQAVARVRLAFKTSIGSTAGLGLLLLLAGAPLGRTCITLTAYTIAMVAVLKLTDRRVAVRA